MPGLEPDRAPVIVAGAVILREMLAHYGLETIEVSGHDLLDGAALAAAELPEAEEGAPLPARSPAADPRPRPTIATRCEA